jgi:hypothetical protein
MTIRIGNTRSRKPGNANPVTLGIIFALVGGALFFLFALPPLQYSMASRSWPTVSGTVTRSDVDVWKSDGKTHYQPDIAYAYFVDGRKYSSSKITVGDPPLDNSVAPAKRMQAKYPVGEEVLVYYDPELPESSALEPGTKSGDYLLAAICALFFISGLLVLYRGLKAKQSASGVNQVSD